MPDFENLAYLHDLNYYAVTYFLFIKMNIYKPYYLVFLFLLATITTIQAQNENTAISLLKEGTLLVKLPSYQKKLQILTQQLQQTTKKRAKKRLQKQLTQTRIDRDTMSNRMQRAFQRWYDFSAVQILVEDTALTTDSTQFYLRYGFTDRSTTAGVEAWIITDFQFKDLAAPFPYYVPVKSWSRKIPSAVEGEDRSSSVSREEYVVYRLNQRLWSYYESKN